MLMSADIRASLRDGRRKTSPPGTRSLRRRLTMGLAVVLLTILGVALCPQPAAAANFALVNGVLQTPVDSGTYPAVVYDFWRTLRITFSEDPSLGESLSARGQASTSTPWESHDAASKTCSGGVDGVYDPRTGVLSGSVHVSWNLYVKARNYSWTSAYTFNGRYEVDLSQEGSTARITFWGSKDWNATDIEGSVPPALFEEGTSCHSDNWGMTVVFDREGALPTIPLIPPGAIGTVLHSGTTSQVGWPRSGGGLDWRPLYPGDALVPGCVILVGGEGDPQAGGGRVKIALSETFTFVVEPHSRVEVLKGGLRVESGSVEVSDQAPVEDYNTYNDNGFCSGKDPGAAQPPFLAQGLSSLSTLAAAASGDVRYRFEALPGGARVSVLEGAAQVKSTATQATALLRTGQQVTVTPQGLEPVREKSFTDVTPTTPYRTAIIGMALREIVNGYKQGDLWEFRPLDPVKRAQFAKMIVGAMMIAPKTSTQTRFLDLGAPDAAGYPHVFVQAAYEHKITTGTNSAQTMFGPWDPIKRAQVVTMIVRAANELWPGVLRTPPAQWLGQMSSFTDVNHGATMRTAEYNGLLEGLQGFGRAWDPWKLATRGEVAQMLWNLMTR